jgi:hypothetical protein
MDLGIRRVTVKLLLDVARRIDAARIEITEVIDIGGLALRLSQLEKNSKKQ